MELAPPAVHGFTLRFEDPAWERAFWADITAERAQQFHRNTIPLICAFYPVFVVFFATRTSWPADARIGACVANAIGWALSLVFFSWSRTESFRRRLGIAYVAFTLLHTAVWIGGLVAAPDAFVAAYGLPILVLGLLRTMQVSTFAIVTSIGVCTAQIAGYLAIVPITAGFDADATAGHALVMVVAVVIGLPRMRDNHRVVRREYVYRRLSDGLVDATLPRPIADRLKAGERTIADRHDAVSVLFADLVGFTPLTRRIDPAELAALLDRIFTRFDDLAAAEGVEKIKTIGDCYMAAAGVPAPCADHARRIARVALGLRDIVAEVSRETGHDLRVRIGLDTGAAVAGVLGRNKLLYDLWGDVVNTASRMESHGEAGEIQISDPFRRELGESARVRDRGTIEVKGKGPMQTWFLDGLPQ